MAAEGLPWSANSGKGKDIFDVSLTPEKIEKKIRQAFNNIYERIKVNHQSNGTLHRVRGRTDAGEIIEMWYNSDSRKFETAYPKGC